MCFGKFSSLVSRISGDANGDSHPSNKKGKMADRDWAHNFIQWRFNLPVCHPLATIMARVADFSKEAVSRFLRKQHKHQGYFHCFAILLYR